MRTRVEICGIDTATLPKLKNNEMVELMSKLKQGDENARRLFIIGNMRLVLSVIQRFPRNNNNIDDVFQVGCIGLIKAINNFDTSLNVMFSTYAVPMVMGEIRRFLRDNNSIKVTRSVRDIAFKALQAKEELEKNSGKEITVDEISEKLGIPIINVVDALDAVSEPMSIYEPVFNQSGDTILLLDQLKDSKENDEIWTDNVALNDSMKSLTEKERKILYLRYYVGQTQIEVSESIGISQAQVSRLEKCALKRMKQSIK